MKIGLILAARTGSTRLPGKVLKSLAGFPMITFLMRRLQLSNRVQGLTLATSNKPQDNILVDLAKAEGFNVYRGSEDDVVERFCDAAEKFHYDFVVRVTGDCPFVDYQLLDYCIDQAFQNDFTIATTKGQFPVGLDFEIYDARLLNQLHRTAELSNEEREHLTLYFYNNADHYRIVRIEPPKHLSATGKVFTVDTKEDFLFAEKVMKMLPPNASTNEIIQTANGI